MTVGSWLYGQKINNSNVNPNQDQPVVFEGIEDEETEVRYHIPKRLPDKKKFYEKGGGWKQCEPRDFEVVEGEIVKAQRRISGE